MRLKAIKEIEPKHTLRRKRLIKAIPTSDNLYEAGQKSGYSKKSRQMYTKSTKAYIKKFLELTGNELEKCKKRFDMLIDLNLEGEDLKEVRANNENLTRMQGGFKDSSTTVNIITTKEIYNKLHNNLPQVVDETAEEESIEPDIPKVNNDKEL